MPCLVHAARHGLALPAEGAEHLVADVPFARFDHWSSAPVIGRLKTASPLPHTEESRRRQARLEAAVGAFSARRAELLRQRGLLPSRPTCSGIRRRPGGTRRRRSGKTSPVGKGTGCPSDSFRAPTAAGGGVSASIRTRRATGRSCACSAGARTTTAAPGVASPSLSSG